MMSVLARMRVMRHRAWQGLVLLVLEFVPWEDDCVSLRLHHDALRSQRKS